MLRSERAMLRKRAGITQRKLAKLVGINVATMSFWENYEVEVSPEAVKKIATVLTEGLNRVPARPTVEGIAQALVGASK